MSFMVIENKILKKYNKILERVHSLMNIKFDSEPVYGDNNKYIKTKIKTKEIKYIQIFMAKKYQKKTHHISVYQ